MSENKNITAQELSEVKYHDLLAKFTELGIPEVWKAGSKKIDLISKAVDKLKIKQSLESLGLDKDSVSKEVEKMAIKKAKADDKIILEQAKQVEREDKQMVTKIKKANLSKEVLESNIKTIKANLAFGVPGHRDILNKKLEALLDLLSKI